MFNNWTVIHLKSNGDFFVILTFFRAQMLMKSRLAGAQKGHGLLKKKADALQMRFRQILGKIIEVIFYLICQLPQSCLIDKR